ncbi:MAG: hypothetical protein OEZ34_11545 [Spirochaetia bacterium]|nr:hypothetical protein [Spirochaetia bacterium]
MKKTKTRWKIIPGTSFQYYLDQDYFEIRGKFKSKEQLSEIFQTAAETLSDQKKQKHIRKRNKKDLNQNELFNGNLKKNTLRKIPLLLGDIGGIKNSNNHPDLQFKNSIRGKIQKTSDTAAFIQKKEDTA